MLTAPARPKTQPAHETEVPVPLLGESQEAFFDRAMVALKRFTPSINRRTVEILKLWCASPNDQDLRDKAYLQFPEDKFIHYGPRCIFLEHTVPASADGSREEIVYDRPALQHLVDWANYRIRNSDNFAAISHGHTPTAAEKAAGHPMPEVLGYSGPFYLGLLGDVDPKWAIYADEWVHAEDVSQFDKLQRRSPEVWVNEPIENRTMDPIAALGAETPRLDSGMNPYCRRANDDRDVYRETEQAELIMRYSAGSAADAKMEKTMHEFKTGTLHSGSKTGPTVTDRKQAIAIGMNQARKAGADYSAGAAFPGPANSYIPDSERGRKQRYGESEMDMQNPGGQTNQPDLGEAISAALESLMPSIVQAVEEQMNGGSSNVEETIENPTMGDVPGESSPAPGPEGGPENPATVPRGEDTGTQEPAAPAVPPGDDEEARYKAQGAHIYGAYCAGKKSMMKYSRGTVDESLHRRLAAQEVEIRNLRQEKIQERQDGMRYSRLLQLAEEYDFDPREEMETVIDMTDAQVERHCTHTITKYARRDQDITNLQLFDDPTVQVDRYGRGGPSNDSEPSVQEIEYYSRVAGEIAAKKNFAKPGSTDWQTEYDALLAKRVPQAS